MIEDRLSTNSSNEEIFNAAAGIYQDALDRSGYSHKLTYKPKKAKKEKRRQRKILWWNPPYNASVSTNVGQMFLAMLDKHFPKGSELHKLFNRNNVKMSYRTGKNVQSYISSHNKAILRDKSEVTKRPCNCKKDPCPVGGDCGISCGTYRADV